MYKIFEKTQIVGTDLIYLTKCRSTNDIAADKITTNTLKEGAVIVTDHQYEGKGQMGNTWESEPFQNLTFSIYLTPTFLSAAKNFLLNIIASVSLVEILNDVGHEKFTIKWPNDILYGDRKIGGILVENILRAETITSAIIGIGLNVNQITFDTGYSATSLRNIFQKEFNKNSILNQIIKHLDTNYLILKTQDSDNLIRCYLNHLYWLNQRHTFRSYRSQETFEGVIDGIDKFGRLVVKTNDGVQIFNNKEIIYLK